MLLTEDDVREFHKACTADGFELTEAEARICALRFIRLLEIIGRPLPHEKGRLARSDQDATIEGSLAENTLHAKLQ